MEKVINIVSFFACHDTMGNFFTQILSCFRAQESAPAARISINCACFQSSAVDQCDNDQQEEEEDDGV